MFHSSNTLHTELVDNGGFTYHLETRHSPSAGDHLYAVAYSKTTERTFRFEAFTPTDLVNFIADNADALSQENVYLGGWVDNGLVYLDCSLIVDDEQTALEIAKLNEQLAIFCFETMASKATAKEVIG